MSQKTPPFKILISSQRIEKEISLFANQLNQTYADSSLFLVAVLKGAVCFLADLMRELTIDVEIGFVRASSYGQKGTERGELTIEEIGSIEVQGKDVLLLDDIFDSGITLQNIASKLKEKDPKSLKSAVLLAKKGAQKTPFRPDHILFEIEDHFVIGYGLDHKEKYRHLPDICIWEETP